LEEEKIKLVVKTAVESSWISEEGAMRMLDNILKETGAKEQPDPGV